MKQDQIGGGPRAKNRIGHRLLAQVGVCQCQPGSSLLEQENRTGTEAVGPKTQGSREGAESSSAHKQS